MQNNHDGHPTERGITMYAVDYGTRTDTGRVRDTNEDTLLVTAPQAARGHLFLVADGVGGELYGTRASQLGAQSAHDTFFALLDAHGDRSPDTDALRSALCAAFQTANNAVYAEAQSRHVAKHMATTLVAIALTESATCVAWVGDSRLYHLPEGNTLKQVTVDHSLVNDQLARGEISREQAATHPRRNVLVRSIGGREDVEVDSVPLAVAQGDVVMLCSDGLTRHIGDREIEHLLRLSPDAQSAADQLVDLANQRGGKDNISVIVLDFGKPPAPHDVFEAETLGKRPDGLDPVALPARELPLPQADPRAWLILLILIVIAAFLAVLVLNSG